MIGAVRAGGGVILREGTDHVETLLIHRPRYDDWTLPKGKALDGEDDAAAALREVREETGLVCDAGPELPSASYRDSLGREKLVRYWLMRVRSDIGFSPSEEVDRIRWMAAEQASSMLGYARDRMVLTAGLRFAEPLFLVRHAKAGSRQRWTGDDRLRPLSPKGRRQAEQLIDAFAGTTVRSILSGPSDRCRQSVEPLAKALGLEIEIVPWLDEGTAVPRALGEMAATPGPAVLSSHGDVIPGVITHLAGEGVPVEGPLSWKKGSTWVVERRGGTPSLLRYEPPPRDRRPSGA